MNMMQNLASELDNHPEVKQEIENLSDQLLGQDFMLGPLTEIKNAL